MKSVGNVISRELYEYHLPNYYARPAECDAPAVREHWIRAKYVRKEFMRTEGDAKDDDNATAVFMMPERTIQGFMMKSNPKGKMQKRWFSLYGRHLSYFKEPSDSYPKGTIDIKGIEVKIPETCGEGKLFQFEVISPGRTYTFATEEPADMFNWIHAIRRAQQFYDTVGANLDNNYSEAKIAAQKKAKRDYSKVAFRNIGKPIKVGNPSKLVGSLRRCNRR
jgi:hypothetical protein